MKYVAIAVALFASTTVLPAAAQVVSIAPIERNVVVQPFGITAGNLETKAITDAQGNRLGDVERVIGTAAGVPTALVIDAENSESHFVVPLERFSNANGMITVNVTATELAQLPVYAGR